MSASENLFNQLTDESSIADQYKAILEQLKKLDTLDDLKAAVLSNKEEMLSQGKALSDLQDQQLKDRDNFQAEIASLKLQLNEQALGFSNHKTTMGATTNKLADNIKKVDTCTVHVDDREQNSRNYCGRFNGLDVSSADGLPELEHEQEVMKHLHEVFKPILEANNSKLGLDLDNPNSYLETAHILPMPKKGVYKCPPIYIRFKKRTVRNVILAKKRELKVRECDTEKGVFSYAMSADLTQMRHSYMQNLIASKSFLKIWHNDGQSVKFTLPGNPGRVVKVKMFEYTTQALIAKYYNAVV